MTSLSSKATARSGCKTKRMERVKDETIERCIKFRDDRDWKQFHNPKDLALSISLEANELLELYQWKNGEDIMKVDRKRVAEELADVILYCISFADRMDFDLDEILNMKMDMNAAKYPVELAMGSAEKYDELKRRAENKA